MAISKISSTATPQDVSQVVNQNVKNRKKRRLFILILLLLLLFFLVFFSGFFAFYLINARDAEGEVVLDIRVNSYDVSNAGGNQNMLENNVYTYKKGDDTLITKTKPVNYELTSQNHIRLDYDINNRYNALYNYEIDFSDLTLENFEVVFYLNVDGKTNLLTPNENGKMVINFSSDKSLVLSIVIRVVNNIENGNCSGNLNFSVYVD